MREIVLVAGTMWKDANQTAEWFEQRGALVYKMDCGNNQTEMETVYKAIEKEGKLDYLIIQTDVHGKSMAKNWDYEDILGVFDESVNGTNMLIEKMLPLLQKGKKRLGLITSADTSIRQVKETKDYGYAMAQASLHMMWKLYFNKLRPEGYTFRCFCPNSDGSGISAGEYMHMDFCFDEKEPYIHSEENHLVMRDGYFRDVPW